MCEKKPITSLRAALSQFVLPENEKLSLKLVFDNLKNYVICIGLFAGLKVSLETLDIRDSEWPFVIAAGMLMLSLLSLSMLALNIKQSIRLMERIHAFLLNFALAKIPDASKTIQKVARGAITALFLVVGLIGGIGVVCIGAMLLMYVSHDPIFAPRDHNSRP